MIQGKEESNYYSGVMYYIYRNDQCEGIYIEYDPENPMHVAIAQYGAYMDGRIELFFNYSDSVRMSNEDLCYIGSRIHGKLERAFKAGIETKIKEIKGVLNIVDPRR